MTDIILTDDIEISIDMKGVWVCATMKSDSDIDHVIFLLERAKFYWKDMRKHESQT
jgi:hypothetical protein